ncbi:S41 family peptidase [Ramlibacter sp. AN1015]|uniref:S41 family peptidase n=1 Tax=Ramlibacter sp. AN1015 TaxID=3133428 RepID=UPI0030BE119E
MSHPTPSTLSTRFPGRRTATRLVGLAAALLLAACGGGGGGGDGAAADPGKLVTPTAALAPSPSLAGICTLQGEQAFARSYLNDRYLWWDRVPEVASQEHASVQSYFGALLLREPDASGRPTDRYSAVLTTSQADAMLTAVATPMAAVLATGRAGVPLVATLSSPGGRAVGYLQFDRHGKGAQDALIAAFEALRAAEVPELVLDLRNNPGGYLYVAQAVASMVAGADHNGKLFEELRYSDKRRAEGAGTRLQFTGTVQTAESRYPKGHPLPQLGLPRLYVLASGATCSASESIVNGLRGVGIEVVLVGQPTCGKPYGFHRKDNCGKSYFAIEFQSVNAVGFGDYASGMAPQCPVQEDRRIPLGDAREPLLAAALHHIDTGACPAAPAPLEAAATKRASDPWDGLAGRLLAPQ